MGQTLADKQFVQQLLGLQKPGTNAILRVRAEGTCSEAHVRDGKVTFVAGGLPSDSIGRELVRRGQLSVQDYQNVVERRMTIQGRRKFGDVALELEVIDEPTLTTILQEQIRHKLARCLHWDSAVIEVEETSEVMPVPPDGEVVTVEEVLVLAARRHYGPSRVRMRLGTCWDTPVVIDDSVDLSSLALDETDQARVERLRREKPSEMAPSPEADRELGTLMIALWLAGAIELPAPSADEPAEGDYESGLAGTFGVRSSRDRLLADSAFLQGRELFEQGEYAAAADAYETACGLRPRAREYALALAWARNLANGSDEASLAELQSLCDAALAQDRHLGLAYQVRGHLAVQQGDKERAREELTLAVAFDPSDQVSGKMLEELDA